MYKQAKVIAEVRDNLENNYLVLEQKNKIERGAIVELIMPDQDKIDLKLNELFDLNHQPIESTPHARMLFLIPYENAEEIPKGSYLKQVLS